ncbi:MAG: hypothetical protein V1753_04795 [Pseudomonadota bacterium]
MRQGVEKTWTIGSSYDVLAWQAIAEGNAIKLLDPLHFIDWQYQVLRC